MGHPLRELRFDEDETLFSWNEELEPIDRGGVDDNENELMEEEILNSTVPRREPSKCPIGDCETYTGVQKGSEDIIKADVEFTTRCVVTGI